MFAIQYTRETQRLVYALNGGHRPRCGIGTVMYFVYEGPNDWRFMNAKTFEAYRLENPDLWNPHTAAIWLP